MAGALAYTLTQLVGLVSLSAKTIRRLIDAGLFPRPIYPTEGKPLWTAQQVDIWLRAKEAGLIPPLPRKGRQEKSAGPQRAPERPRRENKPPPGET